MKILSVVAGNNSLKFSLFDMDNFNALATGTPITNPTTIWVILPGIDIAGDTQFPYNIPSVI